MPPIDHVWLVHGDTGAYSDHCEWIVCAYLTEEEAKTHAERAQARADALKREYERSWDIPRGANEWDLRMDMDYNGTRYTHSMVDVKTLKA